MHLNLVIFSGIIDGPIDIRQSRSGTEVMSFPLLVIRPSRAGYGREERLRLRTVSFGRAHESIRSLLAQGDTVLIQGELTYYEGGGHRKISARRVCQRYPRMLYGKRASGIC